VVQANLLAAQSPDGAGDVFNTACGDRITLNEMLSQLEALMGRKIARSYVTPRPGDVPHSQAQISKLHETFNYEPTVTFADGLRQTFGYFKEIFKTR
jgi:UDP-glucose 4-epimerase